MLVDAATLRDLEIVDGTTPLADLLDCTNTSTGRVTLRDWLRNPPANLEALLVRQRCVRHLVARIDDVRSALASLDTAGCEAYTSLRWQGLSRTTAAGRVLETLVLRVRYGDAVRDIAFAMDRVRDFLRRLPVLIEAVGDEPPEALRSLKARLQEGLRHPGVERAIRLLESASLQARLEADHLARGEGAAALRDLLACIGELDALHSLAWVAREQGWSFPEIEQDSATIEFDGLVHPMLPDGVPNKVACREGERLLAVTGPNMAGKTTLLKAVALAVYLAHIGGGVPARRARLGYFDALFASLYVRDNLVRAESFYISEVRRIRDLLELLGRVPRVFAVVDEPFKGTNIHDASDATGLLLDGLCGMPGATALVATHLAETVRRREGSQALVACCLGASHHEGGLQFDFRLRRGVSDQRLGMELLRREGVAALLQVAAEGGAAPKTLSA